MNAKEWLRLNDPRYVSPQKKAARTRAIPFDPHKLGELLAGQTTRKIGGVWKTSTPIAFAGTEEDLRLDPIDVSHNPERLFSIKAKREERHKGHGGDRKARNRKKAEKRKARQKAIRDKRFQG